MKERMNMENQNPMMVTPSPHNQSNVPPEETLFTRMNQVFLKERARAVPDESAIGGTAPSSGELQKALSKDIVQDLIRKFEKHQNLYLQKLENMLAEVKLSNQMLEEQIENAVMGLVDRLNQRFREERI